MSKLLAVALALIMSAAVHAASLGKQCRRSCAQTITDCAATTGKKKGPCKKQVLRRCKREGLATCQIAVSTTTTLTSSPTSSTSSTEPGPTVDLSGRWIVAQLDTGRCTVPLLAGPYQLTQRGKDLDIGLGATTLSGRVSGRGNVVVSDGFDDGGCQVRIDLRAELGTDGAISGDLDADVRCQGPGSCRDRGSLRITREQ